MQTINVWTNGCFDILHIGHIELLKFAKMAGDNLVVGIDSDRRIKQNKGLDRPYNNQKIRKQFLESVRFVDKVLIFDSDIELETFILQNRIDKMVVGSDWKDKKIIGQQNVKETIFFDRIANYSTTNILRNFK